MLVPPRLDITESGELVTVEGDDRLCLAHLCRHVVGRAFRYTGATHLRRVGNSLENGVNKFYMTLVGNQHFYVFHFISFFFLFFLNDYLL